MSDKKKIQRHITTDLGVPIVVMAPTNIEIMSDPLFIKACELARTAPTLRQASKYFNRRGLAYCQRHLAAEHLRGVGV